MDRSLIAYLLIAAFLAIAIGAIAYARYNSQGRLYGRQRKREAAAYDKRMAADADPAAPPPSQRK